MKTITVASRTLAKRTIWEIEPCFKCALIGTCLSRAELRKLSKEKVYKTQAKLDDYQLHTHFIQISDTSDASGRALQKYLNKKYRTHFKKYHLVKEESEIMALWKEDLSKGNIDAGWWSLLVHPYASASLVSRCYGELHMLSHDWTNSMFRTRKLIADLRSKLAMLEEVMGSERQQFRKDRKKLLSENSGLHQELAAAKAALSREESTNELPQDTSGTFNKKLEQKQEIIESIRQENNLLVGQLDALSEESENLRRQVAHKDNQLQTLQQVNKTLEQRSQEQARELSILENQFFDRLSEEQSPCSICADKDTSNCPGLNLCGKTVLYVGGLHKMVPHYRQLVEQSGGRFLHHDGGKEASRNILPKLLNTADAVLCPIDCVSHDACKCVKKMCKRYQKPFVPMRSSGLSSLARGLSDIVQ
ncbi:DUF2325 domain-containing protein [Desulfobulbus rhabdoformis]|uniref:DUF2325 domain-containing protein n=1 Tax=Desulfobulbus rhabdoformis TaxID=34032 RepID=UPI001962420B|nr:DUF2325 domain-containing protein [Desulfobulbus rhabdoformis]MBM9612838.1 DUF2325 domain-containing protein [Desulfobulbus rhabdoformis]